MQPRTTNINNNNGVDGRINLEQNRNAPIQEGQRYVQGEGVNRRTIFVWGGRFHNVPMGFQFPAMTLHKLIVNWFIGNEHPNVPPL